MKPSATEKPRAKVPSVAPEKPAPEPASTPPHPSIPLNRRQRLEKAIADNPADVASYVALAELWTGEGRHSEAERILTRALAASGGDLKVRELLENAQIRRARAQLAIAENRAVTFKTAEAAELAAKLRADLNRLELEVFDARCQRYPEEPGLKYELGVRLKRAGNYTEAINYLTQGQADPRHRAAATLELGECFQQLRQYTKALEHYVTAAGSAEEDPERRKLALYRAGVLAHGLKDAASAVKYLSQLVEMDAQYKDAADRLDKARQIGHK
jgi:tetratricopeptide (TPR) repeat protein